MKNCKLWNGLYSNKVSSKDAVKDDLNKKYILNNGHCPNCHKEMLKASNGWNCWDCKLHIPKYKKIR